MVGLLIGYVINWKKQEKNMSKRSKLSRSGSRKLYQATVNKVHVVNILKPMRGGVRL